MKEQTIHYRTVDVDGLSIFYREAGDKSRPALLLLNGIPNASAAFRELMHDLGDSFYLVAPDFPGFGHSAAPDPAIFDYTFGHISEVMERFIDVIGLQNPGVYALGYGGPVAFRIAVRRPDLFSYYILQNTNLYEEGLGPAMHAAAPFLKERNEETLKLVKPLLTPEGLKLFFMEGVKDVSLINPDNLHQAVYYLNRPGQEAIQLDLLYNYSDNISEYPTWQNFLKEKQPRILLVWGKNDPFFPVTAAQAIKKDIPGAELHIYDTGHLALEEYHKAIANNIRAFIQ